LCRTKVAKKLDYKFIDEAGVHHNYNSNTRPDETFNFSVKVIVIEEIVN